LGLLFSLALQTIIRGLEVIVHIAVARRELLGLSVNLHTGQSPDQLSWSAWGGEEEGKKRQEGKYFPLTTNLTYRSGDVYRDLGHLQECLIEVLDSFLSRIMALETDKSHPPLGQDMSVGDLETDCKMIAELIIGACRWKTTDEHASVLHFGVRRKLVQEGRSG
jgi:hypothetical protein